MSILAIIMAGLKRSAADNGASLGTGLFKKYKASNLVDPLVCKPLA